MMKILSKSDIEYALRILKSRSGLVSLKTGFAAAKLSDQDRNYLGINIPNIDRFNYVVATDSGKNIFLKTII